MELKEHKSALAALATLGVTAVAAGATAFVKIREKRRQKREAAAQEEAAEEGRLTAEQHMVYNEAIRHFLQLNDRIYELRRYREELQPLVKWLATAGEEPKLETSQEEIVMLKDDIKRFLTTQLPFINACLNSISNAGDNFVEHVRGAVGGHYDDTLDEEPTGAAVSNGTPISYVLRLGYYFPDTHIAPHAVKSVVLA